MFDASGLLLSVAIPTFRRPQALLRCVESVVSQDPGDGSVEFLIIDNDFHGSAAELVAGLGNSAIRYVREQKPGVVNARNRAIAESRASYLAFIDDDELACEGWLEAVLNHVRSGVDASFGPVVPSLQNPPEEGIEEIIGKIFSRNLNKPQDSDVSSSWALLGTGNSLFSKEKCFSGGASFDVAFNDGGGEDTWLIRSLAEKGLILRWNQAAIVEECIPPERCGVKYLCGRRARQGQNRVTNALNSSSLVTRTLAPIWIGVGAFQLTIYGAQAAALWLMRSTKYKSAIIKASGGLGKLLWWRWRSERAYSGQ